MSSQDPRLLRTVDAQGQPLAIRVDEQYVCDFCLSPSPSWEFPVRPMRIVGHPAIGMSEDEWLACSRCRELVETRSIGALVERACQEQRRNVPAGTERGDVVVDYPPLPIQRRVMRENVTAFFDALDGPGRPWS